MKALKSTTPSPWEGRTQCADNPASVRGRGGRLVAHCDDQDVEVIAACRNAAPALLELAQRLVEIEETSQVCPLCAGNPGHGKACPMVLARTVILFDLERLRIEYPDLAGAVEDLL
jgi:hypothetical protein